MWGSPASNQQAAANYDDNRSAAVRFHWIRTAQRWPFFFFSRTNWFNSLCLTFNNFFKLKSRRLMTAMQMRGCGTLRYDLADEKKLVKSTESNGVGSRFDLIWLFSENRLSFVLIFLKKVSHQGRSSVRTFHLEIAGLSFELFRLFTHHSVALWKLYF